MNTQLEKIFFNYILRNKNYFELVQPYFFKNNEIKFIYGILHKYILENVETPIPSIKQIWDMVSLEDKQGLITKEIFSSIFKVDLNEYDIKNFIEPKLKSWILKNKLKAAVMDVVEETRDLDDILDYEETLYKIEKVKNKIGKIDLINTDDDDMIGLDFDNPENHIQDFSSLKIKTGFKTLDKMLGGGWDVNTLNVIMGQTNCGKSLWLQNFAVKSANLGYNVVYITLEMSEKKVMKRIGSMRLKIPIDEYDELSKNQEFIKDRINNLLKNGNEDNVGIFDKKVGKIIVKFWAAGTATINDFDIYLNKLKERKGIKIDMIIVDYLTLVAPIKGAGADTLYTKGKHISEGLRALASKYNCPLITAVQVTKDSWNSSDISIESVPDSKAIVETSDTFFAIIRSKDGNVYRFKLLKQRDGGYIGKKIQIDLNKKYLLLENERFVDEIN